jgi:hypothetical protein
LTVEAEDEGTLGFAQFECASNQHVEDGLEIEPGAADDLEDFRDGSLSLLRLIALAGKARNLRLLASRRCRRTTSTHGPA